MNLRDSIYAIIMIVAMLIIGVFYTWNTGTTWLCNEEMANYQLANEVISNIWLVGALMITALMHYDPRNR